MKIIARQVPPEFQESPLFLGPEFFPDNVAIFGNRQYQKHFPDHIGRVFDALDNSRLLDEWDELQDGHGYNTWADVLTDLVPPVNRGPYTRPDRLAWKALADDYYNMDDGDERPYICRGLELMTGQKWDYTTLRGCCQGDWQYMIYPVAEWTAQAVQYLEIEYFNTGDEWNMDPDGDSVCVYTHEWDDDAIRRELADAYGCDADDIILQRFTGWSRTANYEEV